MLPVTLCIFFKYSSFCRKKTGRCYVQLSHLIAPFRSRRDILIYTMFLLGPNNEKNLRYIQYCFRGDLAPVMPTQKLIPSFFYYNAAVHKCWTRFFIRGEKRYRVVLNDVKKFFGQRMYVIPCGAVAKNDDPNHKIIQNYSYPSKKSGSINVVSQHVYVVYHIQ